MSTDVEFEARLRHAERLLAVSAPAGASVEERLDAVERTLARLLAERALAGPTAAPCPTSAERRA